MIHVVVLGAAAGGGFPQWNSNNQACQRARAGDVAARPATQASIAVSADGERWFLVNAAPDLREQINRQPHLHPKSGIRSSPINGIFLTNGDVDAIAGLLHLRERTPYTVFAHSRILSVLDANPIFNVLAPDVVSRTPMATGHTVAVTDIDGQDTGLRVLPFEVPGKIALFLEQEGDGKSFGTEAGDTIGLEITCRDDDARLVFVANCAAVTPELADRINGASVLFFDGTLWHDQEMVRSAEGAKTGQRMGHMSMSGEDGSIKALANVAAGRKIFIHINNTNPALLADSDERRSLEAAGWQVAYDGMEFVV